jgi:hypothetical protein
LHQYNDPICNEFFTALADTEDMELFNNKGIKMLVEYRWPLAREYVSKRLFFPFVAFLFTFVLYMGTIYEWRDETDMIYQVAYLSCTGIISALALYFLGVEGYQLT